MTGAAPTTVGGPRRWLLPAVAAGALLAVVGLILAVGGLLPTGPTANSDSPATPSALAALPTPTEAAPTPEPTPTPIPTATPIPLVPAPLTGRLVSRTTAENHPIAVMVDDHVDARPQAGFNAAAVVWQAPAEGGIPRYMLVFQDQVPDAVGPIRSARLYYVQWAAELNAMFVHHGGSPQAKAILAAKGNGSWVWNADGLRWEGRFVFRVSDRFSPHNVMTDGSHLRRLAKRVGAVDGPIEAPWSFGPDAALTERPVGGRITIQYPYEKITYRYDPLGNRYVRYVNNSKTPQVDVGDGQWVAPKNVVILRMFFGAIANDHKDRLEARNVGQGEAWIASNGVTVKGTWKKASETAPTLLYGPDGSEIVLTAGQTFVQVIAMAYDYTIADGPLPGAEPVSSPAPSP